MFLVVPDGAPLVTALSEGHYTRAGQDFQLIAKILPKTIQTALAFWAVIALWTTHQ